MAGINELRLRTMPVRILPRRNRLLAESPVWAMASVYCPVQPGIFQGARRRGHSRRQGRRRYAVRAQTGSELADRLPCHRTTVVNRLAVKPEPWLVLLRLGAVGRSSVAFQAQTATYFRAVFIDAPFGQLVALDDSCPKCRPLQFGMTGTQGLPGNSDHMTLRRNDFEDVPVFRESVEETAPGIQACCPSGDSRAGSIDERVVF